MFRMLPGFGFPLLNVNPGLMAGQQLLLNANALQRGELPSLSARWPKGFSDLLESFSLVHRLSSDGLHAEHFGECSASN